MKKIVSEIPFTEGVSMVVYEDGSKGFKSTREGNEIPEDAIDDVEASPEEMQVAIQESNPMMKKYIQSLKGK
jgi:NAD(P)H-flavin reductase